MKIHFNSAWFKEHRKVIAIVSIIAFIVIAMFLFVTSAPNVAFAQATVTPTNTLTPSPTPTLTPTPLATGLANPSGNVQYMICGRYSFGEVTPGACLQVYNGSDIEVFSSAGRRTWYLDGETGNVTVYGSISEGASGVKCVDGEQSFIGSATVIPATLTAAGISTPRAALMSFASSPNNDHALLWSTSSGGAVTLNAGQAILGATLTPQAATTTVSTEYRVCGN